MSETASTDKLKSDVVELVKKIDHVIKSADKEQLKGVSVKAEQFKTLFLKGMKADWKSATYDFYAEKFGAVETAYTAAHAAAEKELAKVAADYGKLLPAIVKAKNAAFAAGLHDLVKEADRINTDLRAAYAKEKDADVIKTYQDELDKLESEIKAHTKTAAAAKKDDADDGKSWKFIDAKADFSAEIQAAANKVALAAYDKFAAAAKKHKTHPVDVARDLGMECKSLKGSATQYEIKLSGKQRATFTVNEKARSTTVLQVGGHT